MVAEQKTVVMELPVRMDSTGAALHDFAADVFREPGVRSVTIDHGRTTATVRKRPSASLPGHQSADAAACELLSWHDPRDGSTSFIRMPARARGWRKAVYLALAAASLALGMLGIVLPGLPTTPFVLLGSFFLVRSSMRLHERLIASRLFGGILRDWHLHRGLRPHVKVRAVAVVAIVVAVSLLVARPPWPAVAAIALLAACGLTVIWRLPRL